MADCDAWLCIQFRDALAGYTTTTESPFVGTGPRSPESLRYFVRFTLANELGEMLGRCKSLFLRPGVVLLCLYELIRRGHEAFAGKGEAEELRQQMKAKVEKWYPETEADVPLEERQGHMPPGQAGLEVRLVLEHVV